MPKRTEMVLLVPTKAFYKRATQKGFEFPWWAPPYLLSTWRNRTWPNLPGLPPPYLHTVRDQILEVGMAWKRGYSQGFLQASPDIAMLFAPFRRTHPPPPVLPFLLTHNLSPKDIARSNILKLKVSRHHMQSLGRKGLNSISPSCHLKLVCWYWFSLGPQH